MNNNKPIQNTSNARYRGLIFSIVIFLLLIASILGLNLYSSIQINRDNAAINAATKMRDNIQGINRDLLNLKLSYGEDVFSPNIDSSIKRLKNSTNFFSKALKVFETGGILTGQGTDDYISPVGDNTSILGGSSSEKGRLAITEMKNEWQNFKPLISDYIETAQTVNGTVTTLDLAVNQAQGSGVIIYNEMETLVQDIKSAADKRANLLKIIQIAGISLVILYFIIFIFFFIKRLRQADKETEDARRETNDILETVNNGLFLLDKDLTIGSQHSKALEDILLTKNIGGEKLSDMLSGIVSKENIEITGDFIEQLYNPRVKTKLINDLNPLRQILVNLEDAGVTKSKYLDFSFSRIYADKEISHILVSVNDITNAVLLEEKLEKERRQNDEQIQMVTTILNSDIRIVREFVKNSKKITGKINDILRDSKKGTHVLEDKLKQIFREAHSLKGESSALNLKSLTQLVTNFEEDIKLLQKKPNLTGDDFLALTVRLDEIIGVLQTIGMLSQRLGVVQTQSLHDLAQAPEHVQLDNSSFTQESNTVDVLDQLQQADNLNQTNEVQQNPSAVSIPLRTQSSQAAQAPIVDNSTEVLNFSQNQQDDMSYRHGYYQNFVKNLAERSKKRIKLDIQGIELLDESLDKHQTIKEIALQLIRNSVTHGIELPSERIANAKSDTGTIKLVFKDTGEQLSLSVEDDGSGIDYEAIRRKAIATGKFNADEVATWNNRKLLSLIFSSGFSTASQVTEDAGQGVGLDVVKSRMVEIGGKLKIDTQFGEFTRFQITCSK